MGLLRIILALAVVITHTEPFFGLRLTGGIIAVQAFYIISGFYMSLILNEKYIKLKKKAYQTFLTNRLLRIYPMYLAVLAAIIIISFLSGLLFNDWIRLKIYFQHFQNLNIFSFIYLIASNILIFGQDIVMFMGLNTNNGNLFFTRDFHSTNPELYRFLFIPQAWTLSLELTFYAIAPFLVRRRTNLLLFMIFLSLSGRFFAYQFWGLNNDPWTYRFFPFEIVFFLLGILSYKIYRKINLLENPSWLKEKRTGKIIYFLIILSTISFEFIPVPIAIKQTFYYILIFTAIPILFNYTKNNPQDRWLGEFSYPVYISHLFIIWLLGRILDIWLIERIFYKLHIKTGLYFCELTFLVSLVASYFLIKFVGEKVEKIRQKKVKSLS